MRLLVIGAGAIGMFVGGRLALAGHDVCLVGRPALLHAVQSSGLTLLEPNAAPRTTPVRCVHDVGAAFSGAAGYDLALLTVKAYDTDQAITELRAATSVVPPILTLQNGVGNEESLAAAFGPARVLSATIDTPVSIPRPGQIEIHKPRYGVGLATLGDPESLALTADALREAGFTVQVFGDYRGLKWSKLLMNMLANAQCAILGWTPAQVMADPLASVLEARAWQEAAVVMRRLGIVSVALGGYPFPQLMPLVEHLPARWVARGLGRFVAGGRGAKLPSLYLALQAEKPSEVRWLNGAVTRYGAEIGAPTPVNRVLTEVLEGLTRRTIVQDAFRADPRRLAALVEAPHGADALGND